ncbi:MAG: porin family protein [Firmicutes bacterium]|nr:porin family protein [Bacillota bacterium]MCM1401400.1 porin family protein [Bacteroides sp.]MCM1477330.1 porin family protein [Bacteroides sp.]
MKIGTLIAPIALSIMLLLPTAVMAQHKGEKSVGLRGGFTTRQTTATAGLYFSYRFTEHFRISPKMDYAFRHKGTDAFSFDMDFEMPFSLSPSGKANFYPIAGLNYSTFSTHTIFTEDNGSDDTSQRSNEFGLALGAGVEYFATPTLRLAFESKGILIKKYSGGWFNVSIGYVF